MEVTLEKIELVKDRTGVSYKEAREALEANDGSVVDAIISIEDTIDAVDRVSPKEQGSALLDSLKSLVRKGNVSRIQVKNREGESLLNVPVNAGIIGAVVAPIGTVVAVVATIGFKCTVEVVKDDGTIVDVSDRAADFAEVAKEKASDAFDVAKDKAYEARDKAGEAFDAATDTVKNTINRDDDVAMAEE